MDGVPADRAACEDADRLDPLAKYREQFLVDEAGPIYLDGNSLGRQPVAARAAVATVLSEWRRDLVGGWERWISLGARIGDRVGTLVGAARGQVALSDSTSVNLYKLAVAALDARGDRAVILGDANDFPTVRYVLQGIARREGHRLRLLDSDPAEGLDPAAVRQALDDDVALVCLSGVNYRSGAVLDLAEVTAAAHDAGALTLFDLSHAAGAVPLQLGTAGADLATGCTYKYLNAGPGSPAWLYVRKGLQRELRQPIWGWWGQRDQFAMGPTYDPEQGIERFLVGTPSILGLVAVAAGIEPLLEATMPALWAKAQRLVALLARRVEERLVPLGARLASPTDPARRGGHLAVAHPQAYNASRLLVERGLVVPDFRQPDVLRLAPVPLYTSFTEVYDAVERVATVLADPAVRRPQPKGRTT